MVISEQGLILIKHYEGLRLNRYRCPSGFWTIGYGHLWKEGEPLSITVEQANIYLSKIDIANSIDAVNGLIHVPLTQGQFDALVSFVFNLGYGNLHYSTLRMKLNREEYLDAALEFPRWCKSNGYTLKGLLRRRYSEQILFLAGSLCLV